MTIGPVYGREKILDADLDLGEIIRGKLDFDVAGHYTRPNLFKFSVETRARFLFSNDSRAQ